MTQMQLAVSWDAYQKNVCKGLSFMQERGEFVDMTLAAEGHYVKVHRMVLSLASPYIKELITSVDCPHPVVFLNNISYRTLCFILEYIYTGEVMVLRKDVKELIQAGKALHINGLVDMALKTYYDTVSENNDDNELKYQPDTSAKEDSISDMEVNEQSNDNDTSVYEDTSEILHENVRVKPVATPRLPATDDSSVLYTMSNQGGLQLILNRYIYFMRYHSKNSSQRRWNCFSYRKLNCPAYVTTDNGRVIKRARCHNHPFHDKQILKKFQAGITFKSLNDAEVLVKKKDKTAGADKEVSV